MNRGVDMSVSRILGILLLSAGLLAGTAPLLPMQANAQTDEEIEDELDDLEDELDDLEDEMEDELDDLEDELDEMEDED